MNDILPAASRPNRIRVAEFWDQYLQAWLEGDETLQPPLDAWFAGYKGSGPGEVDLASYPDPYVGDLRGDTSEPSIVMLGINPGVGYAPLQARDGVWARNIQDQGFSRCFSRSPEEDAANWRKFHKNRSRFWSERMKFADVWLDRKATISDVLMMELYPWHSRGLSAPVKPAADLVSSYFFDPIGEIDVSHVFAFSSDWLRMARKMELPCLHSEVMSRNKAEGAKWSLNIFDLPTNQTLVVSTYPNSQPPYGAEFPVLLDLLKLIGRPRLLV